MSHFFIFNLHLHLFAARLIPSLLLFPRAVTFISTYFLLVFDFFFLPFPFLYA